MNDALCPTAPIRIEILSEDEPAIPFSRMRHLQLQNHYPDGSTSRIYTYDAVDRQSVDAVAIVLHSTTPEGKPCMCLRSSLRPPLLVRSNRNLACPEPNDGVTSLWEVPAGLIEADEKGLLGLKQCASRETMEEVGVAIEPEHFELLGPSAFPSPGVIGEKMFWLHAFIPDCPTGNPQGDGSPAEEGAEIRWLTLEQATNALAQGKLPDLKTEIALRRLTDHLKRGDRYP